MSWRRRGALVACAAMALAACGGSLFESNVDYKAANRIPPLDVPPDLTASAGDDRFSVPDVSPAGTATYSAYTAERAGGNRSVPLLVLGDVGKIRVERAGSERWLLVPEFAEKLWPAVKRFWQESGFNIRTESPEAGVMETDWAKNRARAAQDSFGRYSGGTYDDAYSNSERDKFRTRLERGQQAGTTEIYISHRAIVEVIGDLGGSAWKPRPGDPGLEAELLRRLAVRLGVDDGSSRNLLTAASARTDRARIVTKDGVGAIVLDEAFDRAWRRVGLALDREGFAVEDRDRSKGIYFVRYVDARADAQPKDGDQSSSVFWRSSKPAAKPAQYRVQVKERGEASEVQILDKDGVIDRGEVAGRMLAQLRDQLK